MLQSKKRLKFCYSEEEKEASAKALRDGGNPYSISKRFNVPQSTHVNKASGVSAMVRKMGPESTLGNDTEQMIVNWVKAMAKIGFPIKASDLVISVKQIDQDMNITTPLKKDCQGDPG